MPETVTGDDEDVAWGLQTATALWARGERREALVWVRRAAEAAGSAGDDMRAVTLAKKAVTIEDYLRAVEGAGTRPATASSMEPTPYRSTPPVSTSGFVPQMGAPPAPSSFPNPASTRFGADGHAPHAPASQGYPPPSHAFPSSHGHMHPSPSRPAQSAPPPLPPQSFPPSMPPGYAAPFPTNPTFDNAPNVFAQPDANVVAFPDPQASTPRPPSIADETTQNYTQEALAVSSAASRPTPPPSAAPPPGVFDDEKTTPRIDLQMLQQLAAARHQTPKPGTSEAPKPLSTPDSGKTPPPTDRSASEGVAPSSRNAPPSSASRMPPPPPPTRGRTATFQPGNQPGQTALVRETTPVTLQAVVSQPPPEEQIEIDIPPPMVEEEPPSLPRASSQPPSKRARRKQRAPILDPWADEMAMLAEDGPPSRHVQSYLDPHLGSDEDVLTSASSLDGMLRRKAPPPVPPARRALTPPPGTFLADVPTDDTPKPPSAHGERIKGEDRRSRPPPPPPPQRRPTLSGEPDGSETPAQRKPTFAENNQPRRSVPPPSTSSFEPARIESGGSSDDARSAPTPPPGSIAPSSLEAPVRMPTPPPRAPSAPPPRPPSAPPPPPLPAPAISTPPPPTPAPVAVRGASQPLTASIPPAERSVFGLPLDRIEAFADVPQELQQRLAAGAMLRKLNPEEEVQNFGVLILASGAAVVSATIADIAAHALTMQSLASALSSHASAIPSRVVAISECAAALWTREQIEEALRDCPWVVDELRRVGDRQSSLVGATLGPFGDLDDHHRHQVFDRLVMKSYRADDIVVALGAEHPGLVVVGAGELCVEDGAGHTSILSPGDLVFPQGVLDAGTATAKVFAGKEGAIVLSASRGATMELLSVVPMLIELLRVA